MKIICIGRNYAEHAAELHNPLPTEPIVFLKPDTAVLREGKPFFIPDFSNEVQYELEVVLKIAKRGKYIQPQFAHTYYQEIGLGIDFTARDLQNKLKNNGHPWEISKAFDSSAVVGDFLDKSTFADVNNLHLQLRVNDHVRQDAKTSACIFGFDEIISYVSQFFTLAVGDLVYTGTPAGVAAVRPNDVLEGYLEGKKLLHCAIK